MSATMTEEIVETRTTDTPDDAAHIVLVPEKLRGEHTPQSFLLEARVAGIPVTALCGYTWVPSRDPQVLPVCAKCLEIYRHDPHGHGRDEVPSA